MVFAMVVAQLVAPLTQHVPADVASGVARRLGTPAPSQTMELTFELPTRDEAGLHALLTDLYDPVSPRYRHYLSVDQFTERFGPTARSYAAVVDFARANGLVPHGYAANRRVVDVRATIANVDRALHVRIGVYRHPGETRTFFAPDREPSLALSEPILHIAGLDDASLPVSHVVRDMTPKTGRLAPTGSGPDGNFYGSDMRAAYYGGTALTGSGQSLGLFEYAGYDLVDVATYFEKVGQIDSVPIVGVSVNGANLECKGKCDDAEQALDIEQAISMAPGLRQLVVYVGHNDVSIINQMASDDTSKQLSCSWGWNPDPVEIDPLFEEFAAQGQSFLVATGDYGYQLKKGGVWPADDQFVTAIGGTDVRTQGPGGPWVSEIGWAYSGGGPSPDKIPIPAYQVPFVTAANGGSTTLRNVPDISAQANTDYYSCFDGYCTTGSGGTSYAAPLLAGYVALANELASALNQPPAGFLNPFLYRIGGSGKYPFVFHDQVLGYNGAYTAGPGFDLVTGFGSPRGDALIEALVRRR
jgi:kumamolisin